MAIDPKLVSIVPASDLPTGDPTSAGEFFFFEGNEMQKAPMTNIYDKVTSGITGEATQSNAPGSVGFERWVASTPLTLPNSWGFEVTQAELETNNVFFNVTDGVVSKDSKEKRTPPPTGVVEEGNTASVSGGEVYKSLKPFNSIITDSVNLSDNVFSNGAIKISDGTIETGAGAKYKIFDIPSEWDGQNINLVNVYGVPSIFAEYYIESSSGTEILKLAGSNSTGGITRTIPITSNMIGGKLKVGIGANSYAPVDGFENHFMLILGDVIPIGFVEGGKLIDLPIFSGFESQTEIKSEKAGSLSNDINLDERVKVNESFQIVSKNLFDKSRYTMGWMSNTGVVTSSVNLAYSHKIKVSEGVYSFRGIGTGNIPYIYSLTAFDVNGTILPSKGLAGEAYASSYTVDSTVDAIIVSFRIIALDTFQVEKNPTPTEYEPYGTFIDGSKIKNSTSVFFQESNIGNTPILDLKDLDYIHICQYGQSLSIGYETNIAITNIAIDGNYMLGDNVMNTSSTVLTPLVNVDREDSVVATTNVLSNFLRRKVKSELQFIATSSGSGSTTVQQLADETKSAYPKFTSHVDRVKTAVGTSKVGCPIIFYLQGESDYTDSNTTSVANNASTYRERIDLYKSRLVALKNKMQQHIMTTYEQTTPPLFFVHSPSGQWGGYKEKFVHQAHIELAKEYGDIILVGSPYFVPAFNAGHLSTNGYRWWGEKIAEQAFKVLIKDLRAEPILPKKFTINKNSILIDFLVPNPPLQINTTQFGLIPNYGFDVYRDDVLLTLKSVQLIGNSILISVDEDLSSATKIQVNYGTLTAGNAVIGCGNICDSNRWISMYNYADDTLELSTLSTPVTKRPLDEQGDNYFGEKYPMNNWLSVFSEIVKSQ